MTKNWMITGTSSGFGHEIARQALEGGDRVVGTVRRDGGADDLRREHPERFHVELLDVSDTAAVGPAVDRAVTWLGGLDVLVNNAGYGLFGAAEELGDEQIDHQIATNLRGAIQVVRAALPHLRENGGGRILQLSSVAGQSANPAASLYHATKWGIEGFSEALAAEVAAFGIGVTIVEPGGARTGFAAESLQWGTPLPAYDGSVIRTVRGMLEGPGYTALGDPVRMAAAMIESVTREPAPLRLILGSDSQSAIASSLENRLEDARSQVSSAARTDG
jgi:NAD(P)-dependent dehydrogenase (short-subunit alcohol dehydrogenase family)